MINKIFPLFSLFLLLLWNPPLLASDDDDDLDDYSGEIIDLEFDEDLCHGRSGVAILDQNVKAIFAFKKSGCRGYEVPRPQVKTAKVTDLKVAIEMVESMEQFCQTIGCCVDHPTLTIRGIERYFQERRGRGQPLTLAQLQTFLSNTSGLETTSDTFQQWLLSFGPQTSRNSEALADSRTPWPNTIPTFGAEVAGKIKQGQNGLVTRIQGTDGKIYFHKRRSPFLRPSEEKDKKAIIQEFAAYQLDQLLGLSLVPPTMIGSFNGNVGSIQQAVPDNYQQGHGESGDDHRLAHKYQASPDLTKLRLFHYLAAISDTHSGNLFFNSERSDPGKVAIMAIDAGGGFAPLLPAAFPDKYPLSGGLLPDPERLEPATRHHLKNLTYEQLANQLPLLTSDELEGLWMRLNIIKELLNQAE